MNCYLGNMGKGTTTGQGTGTQRALGRSVSDFADLNEAEKEVIAATREGRFAHFGDKIPETEEEKEERKIRAGLVRFLALGGDEATPVHERGLEIQGAVIDDVLDLSRCTLTSDLILSRCELTGGLMLRGARTQTINLDGSHCEEIAANDAEIAGSLNLHNGFFARGLVDLYRASISGNLNCNDARFEGRDDEGDALICDQIRVGGYVFLRNAMVSRAGVWLLGASIARNLECDGAHLAGQNNKGDALRCNSIRVGGSVFLRDGFVAEGRVSLDGATIGGNVDCTNGKLGKPQISDGSQDNTTIKGPVDLATEAVLALDQATVAGTLRLGSPPNTQFHGGIYLTGARIGRIADSFAASIKVKSNSSTNNPSHGPVFLRLDGLTYDRFGERTDLTASARIAFLQLQHEHDLRKDFKPQPWMQMVKVLRETGHAEAAREVAIAYEDWRREAGVIASKVGRLLHRLYGMLVGYGHRPLQLLRITFSLWLFCGAIYFTAAELGVMAPTNPRVFDEPKHDACRPENGGNWTTCVKAPYEYTTFNPWVYSLDLMLPFVDLQQDRDWAPMMLRPCAVTKSVWVTDICWQSAAVARAKGESFVAKPAYWISGTIVAAVMWFEILFGWAASLLLAAVLSGLAKKME